MYFDLANPSVTGNATAIVGYIHFPLVRTKNFQFSLQTGAGLAYLSRKFDIVTDHKNLGIGSHGNSAIRFMFQARYSISKNLLLQLNYGITHFSNTAYRLPNLGINNISLAGGILYQVRPPEKFKSPEVPPPDRRWIFELVYGTGIKENFPPDGNQFFAHTLYLQVLKPLSHKTRIGAGADGFYDLSLRRIIRDATAPGEKRLTIFRGGVHAGYEMQVNHFTLLFHFGYYMIDRIKIDGQFYHRYGLKYDLGKRLCINLSLKTHWARADYAELGLGWKWRK